MNLAATTFELASTALLRSSEVAAQSTCLRRVQSALTTALSISPEISLSGGKAHGSDLEPEEAVDMCTMSGSRTWIKSVQQEHLRRDVAIILERI